MAAPEYEIIVEFSFNTKTESFVIRFLTGESYMLPVSELPKKLQTKRPAWEEAEISPSKTAIMFKAGHEMREIPAHIIHSKGTII
jgi:hypothetical protein